MYLIIGRRKLFIITWNNRNKALQYKRIDKSGLPYGPIISLSYEYLESYMKPFSNGNQLEKTRKKGRKFLWTK
jgi:hypothetical protein